MGYDFEELGAISCADAARAFRSLLVGRYAVCTSFDSGRFIETTWSKVNGYYVTPQIDDGFIEAWPVSHEQFCDEWWIFDAVVPSDFKVNAFCNYVGVRIKNYKDLDWADGCPLDDYLSRYRPVAVIGNNEYAYLIRRLDDCLLA